MTNIALRIKRLTLTGAVFAASWVAGGTAGAAAPSPRIATITCTVPTGPGPGYDASIGLKQNGKTFCLKVGQKLLVFLRAPKPYTSLWHAIHVSPSGILGPAPMTLMLVRGVTASNFRALKPGLVTLSSWRAACPPPKPGAAACMAIEAWRARALVIKS